jgi:hypothetical protein
MTIFRFILETLLERTKRRVAALGWEEFDVALLCEIDEMLREVTP